VRRGGRWKIASALLLAGGCAPAVVSAQNWGDIEGRIQYAYYTEDTRALGSLLASLKPKLAEGEEQSAAGDASIRSYFEALAHYRLAQVQVSSRKSAARQATDDCGDAIDLAVERLPKAGLGLDDPPDVRRQRAEAYALGTACTLAGREMSSVPFAGGRIGPRIDEAVKLEPKNPRVRLVEALAAYDRAGKDAAAKSAAVQKLKLVTAMFEAARAGASTTPEWGAAEAYAFLGRALIAEKDVVGAREALERALLIAPDYAFARRQMAQITR
jgi:hypothetical protein